MMQLPTGQILLKPRQKGTITLMKYLEGEELSTEEIIQGLKIGTQGKVVPVLCDRC